MNLRLLTTTPAMAAVMLAGVSAAFPGQSGITVPSRTLKASLPHPEAVPPTFRIDLLNQGHVHSEKEYAAGEVTDTLHFGGLVLRRQQTNASAGAFPFVI